MNDGSDGFRMCIRELEQACIRSPDLALRQELASRYLQLGRVEECVAIVEDLLRSNPGDPSLRIMLTEAHLEAGELDAAAEGRAALMTMNVPFAELLRISLKLRKARLGPAASDRDEGDGERAEKLPCPSVRDSTEFELSDVLDDDEFSEVSSECCEVVFAAIEDVFDELGSESDSDEELPEYDSGPTREMRLNGDGVDVDETGDGLRQTLEIRRNLADFFST